MREGEGRWERDDDEGEKGEKGREKEGGQEKQGLNVDTSCFCSHDLSLQCLQPTLEFEP